ncbi:MAG: hypothetical protein SFT81_06550 [Candidatus Caenarcaniphilales bacterium]|nr:hypothetical protein [Candidatus Caenarcaniphilales bacterium]
MRKIESIRNPNPNREYIVGFMLFNQNANIPIATQEEVVRNMARSYSLLSAARAREAIRRKIKDEEPFLEENKRELPSLIHADDFRRSNPFDLSLAYKDFYDLKLTEGQNEYRKGILRMFRDNLNPEFSAAQGLTSESMRSEMERVYEERYQELSIYVIIAKLFDYVTGSISYQECNGKVLLDFVETTMNVSLYDFDNEINKITETLNRIKRMTPF